MKKHNNYVYFYNKIQFYIFLRTHLRGIEMCVCIELIYK